MVLAPKPEKLSRLPGNKSNWGRGSLIGLHFIQYKAAVLGNPTFSANEVFPLGAFFDISLSYFVLSGHW